MGKNTITKKHEPVLQLLLLATAVITPFLASNFMDLDLFNASKTMFSTLWSSINPWLYPPYVYLLINFIIFFIFASSFIHSNTTFFNSATDHSYNQSVTDSFIESSLGSQNFVNGSLADDEMKLHTLEETCEDARRLKGVLPELRKSKTFHEGGSRSIGRMERYVRVVSQDELDRRVEAFIYRFKKDIE